MNVFNNWLAKILEILQSPIASTSRLSYTTVHSIFCKCISFSLFLIEAIENSPHSLCVTNNNHAFRLADYTNT